MSQPVEINLMVDDLIVRFSDTSNGLLRRSYPCSRIGIFRDEEFEELLKESMPLKKCTEPRDKVILQVMQVLNAFLVEYIRYGDLMNP